MELYQKNFRVLFLIILIPHIPLDLFLGPFASGTIGRAIYFILTLFVGFFVCATTAIAISDACTGNIPSVERSYRYVFTELPLNTMLVFFAQVFVIVAGFLLLVIPGLVFGAWYMFAQIVVVLERIEPIAAMKRSRFLGKGFYIRNLSLAAVATFLMLIGELLIVVVGSIAIFLFKLQHAQGFVNGVVALLATALFTPYLLTLSILMYYDLRARREGYDSTALTEDLER
jgi:hypothetical protein